MPVVKASKSMNNSVRPSGAPGQSGRAKLLKMSVIGLVKHRQVLFRQHASFKLELLRVNARRVFTNRSLAKVKDFDEVKHQELGTLVEFKLEDDTVLGKGREVRRQVRPPSAAGNLQ